jgi:hypothetical protein
MKRALTLLMTGALVACADYAPSKEAPAESKPADDGVFGKGDRGGGGLEGLMADKVAEAEAPPPPPSAAPARAERKKSKRRPAPKPVTSPKPLAPEPEEAAEAAPTRAWFPETFLFEPLVETGADGSAVVESKVPDRLTRWRVLALAHSRAGAQAGAVTTFQGTLPIYVDPLVPGFVVAGDRAKLPIQLVNATDEAVQSTLEVSLEGGEVGDFPARVQVPARGSKTVSVPIFIPRAGEVILEAKLKGADGVRRTIPARTAGWPKTLDKSGTLAAPRTLTFTLPEDVEPGSAKLDLAVFPGALAVLRSELGAAAARTTSYDAAYLLMLSGGAKPIATSLGAELDDDELTRLRRLATQRAVRQTRSPGPAVAARFAEAALAHEDPFLHRLGERLARQLAEQQRPDGTFGGGSGWTVQRLLALTAEATRALGADESDAGARRARAARLRARGAFSRMLAQADDAFTAAQVLASGAAPPEKTAELKKKVLEALDTRGDGARALPVPDGVVRADGSRPSEIESTALAVLALDDEGADDATKAALADLGAHILASYRPWRGFGDGRTNLVALRAVTALFRDKLPTKIEVTLLEGETALATGVLEGDKLREVMRQRVEIDEAAGERVFTLKAEPAVPGLGFTVTLNHAVPWPKPPEDAGLNLVVERPEKIRAGYPATLTLSASAPGGQAITVHHALPSGVQPDKASLEKLVAAGTLQSFRVEDGLVVLRAPSRRQGQAFVARYRVIPTLPGTLKAAAARVELSGRSGSAVFVPSPVWKIAN